MRSTNEFGDAGQERALVRFKVKGFWTLKGWLSDKECQKQYITCRATFNVLLHQPMGGLPEELRTAPFD